jgi:effector-binding domain-containing protein
MMSEPEQPDMLPSLDYVVSPVRVMTVPEVRLFCVTVQAPFDKLDDELNRAIPLLEAAQAEANIATAGPTVIRYFATENAGQWQMDVGVPISWDWVQATGEAQIVTAPALECGAILHWGSLEHIRDSYTTLKQGIAEAGRTAVGEGREWYLHFAGDTSPDNVILLQLEVEV